MRIVTVFFCAILSINVLAEKRLITENDLFQFKWIGDPQLSQDGKQVAFVNITVNKEKLNYDTSIWRVSTEDGKLQQLTKGVHDTAPRWSHDGKYIAFLRAKDKDGKTQTMQLFVMPVHGGEAKQITKLPKGVSHPVWSSDDQTIAFLSTTNDQDLNDKKTKNHYESDVKVITRAQYRMDSEGYLDFSRPKHIWTVGLSADKDPKQITHGEFSESEIVWAPDGSKIYFTSDRDLEPYYQPPKSAIYSVPTTGGKITEIAKFNTQEFSAGCALTVSPQGDRLAFLGVVPKKPLQSYQKLDVWIVDLKTGTKNNLTSNKDLGIGDWIVSDGGPPRASGDINCAWSADGKSIVLIASKEGRANLKRINIESDEVSQVTQGDQVVSHFSSNGTDFVARITKPTELNDLYFITPKNPNPKRLTQVNEKLFSEIKLTSPLDFWYNSFDGKKIHTFVQLPPNFDANKKYPLILDIHGGPHAAYGFSFFHEMQWLAARGYVVLYPNPRGSTTYGEDFANIIQYRYPNDDYKDLMAGVDALIKKGYVDEKRLGVTGGSGGGLLTNWTIGHTNRFRAAVSQRDIADFATWWYSFDLAFFQDDWFKSPPFVDAKEYLERSPMSYVNNITTPTMFILGDSDLRTPPSGGGEQMFRALKYRKIPTVMLRFPGEGHDLSRAGKPWHRIERLHHLINWFDLYLLDKPTNEYNLIPPKID